MTPRMPQEVAEQLSLVDCLTAALTDMLGAAAPTSFDLLDCLADQGLQLSATANDAVSRAYTFRIRQAAGLLPAMAVIA